MENISIYVELPQCNALIQHFRVEWRLTWSILINSAGLSDSWILFINMIEIIMNFQTIKWTIIISLGAFAYWKIFGRNGVLVSIAIAAIILFLIYTFQNKLLYMPGTFWFTVRYSSGGTFSQRQSSRVSTSFRARSQHLKYRNSCKW